MKSATSLWMLAPRPRKSEAILNSNFRHLSPPYPERTQAVTNPPTTNSSQYSFPKARKNAAGNNLVSFLRHSLFVCRSALRADKCQDRDALVADVPAFVLHISKSEESLRAGDPQLWMADAYVSGKILFDLMHHYTEILKNSLRRSWDACPNLID